MATIIGIAYNPTSTIIPRTEQYGDIVISFLDNNLSNNYGGLQWWSTPDLDERYVISHSVPDGSQPNPLGIPAYVGFWGSEDKTDTSFLDMVNNIPPRINLPDFTSVSEATSWLSSSGYWTSYGFNTTQEFVSRSPEVLCREYERCDGESDVLLIPHEDYNNITSGYTQNVIKWYDGNCYKKTDRTTLSSTYTLAPQFFDDCTSCLLNCTLRPNVETVSCTIVATVNYITPTPTPTPTPTIDLDCITSDVNVITCSLDTNISFNYYNVRLEACCKDYIGQDIYNIEVNLNFNNLIPQIGYVIVYNNICYKITYFNPITNTNGVIIDSNSVNFIITNDTGDPCKYCTTLIKPCISIDPPQTPKTLTLRRCCDGITISTSVYTSFEIIVGDVIVINNYCYEISNISDYIGGPTLPISQNNHFSSQESSDPCKDCTTVTHDCDGITPSPTPSRPSEDVALGLRACCSGTIPFNITGYFTSTSGITYNSTGIMYQGECYIILSSLSSNNIDVFVDNSDLIDNICDGCCDTPTPTPTVGGCDDEFSLKIETIYLYYETDIDIINNNLSPGTPLYSYPVNYSNNFNSPLSGKRMYEIFGGGESWNDVGVTHIGTSLMNNESFYVPETVDGSGCEQPFGYVICDDYDNTPDILVPNTTNWLLSGGSRYSRYNSFELSYNDILNMSTESNDILTINLNFIGSINYHNEFYNEPLCGCWIQGTGNWSSQEINQWVRIIKTDVDGNETLIFNDTVSLPQDDIKLTIDLCVEPTPTPTPTVEPTPTPTPIYSCDDPFTIEIETLIIGELGDVDVINNNLSDGNELYVAPDPCDGSSYISNDPNRFKSNAYVFCGPYETHVGTFFGNTTNTLQMSEANSLFDPCLTIGGFHPCHDYNALPNDLVGGDWISSGGNPNARYGRFIVNDPISLSVAGDTQPDGSVQLMLPIWYVGVNQYSSSEGYPCMCLTPNGETTNYGNFVCTWIRVSRVYSDGSRDIIFNDSVLSSPLSNFEVPICTQQVSDEVNCLNSIIIESIYVDTEEEVSLMNILKPSNYPTYTMPNFYDPGDHSCDKALSEIFGNDIYLGDSNLNNVPTNPFIFEECIAYTENSNIPIHQESDGYYNGITQSQWLYQGNNNNLDVTEYHRYQKIQLSLNQAYLIANSDEFNNNNNQITFELRYAIDTAVQNGDIESGCFNGPHTNQTWVRVLREEDDGTITLVYNGVTNNNIITLNVCDLEDPNPDGGNTDNTNWFDDSCDYFLEHFPATANGVDITVDMVGDTFEINSVNNICYPSDLIVPYWSYRIGSWDAEFWSMTINFSQLVNNVKILLSGTGSSPNGGTETFTVTTNTGTPSIVSPLNCFTTINGNIISSGSGFENNWCPSCDGGGGIFIVNGNQPYTSITLSGNGGYGGSVMALCKNFTVI